MPTTIDLPRLARAVRTVRELADELARNDVTGECRDLRDAGESARYKVTPEGRKTTCMQRIRSDYASPRHAGRLCEVCAAFWFVDVAKLKSERLLAEASLDAVERNAGIFVWVAWATGGATFGRLSEIQGLSGIGTASAQSLPGEGDVVRFGSGGKQTTIIRIPDPETTKLRIEWSGGETYEVTLGAYLRDNIDTPDVCEAVAQLEVGASASFGGGGAPRVTITRLLPP